MLFLTNTKSLKVLNSEKFIKINTVSSKKPFPLWKGFHSGNKNMEMNPSLTNISVA